jgi:Flp pilus assembly pilin Flp
MTPYLHAFRRRWTSLTTPFVSWWFALGPEGSPRDREGGQSTVEYALVLLGAAAVALALVAWVTRSDAISRLFDAVVGRILSQA